MMIGWGGKDFRLISMVSCNTWGGKEKNGRYMYIRVYDDMVGR